MTYQSGDLVLNKYRIENILGKGAFGEVYRITHMSLNVTRAIKVLIHDGIGVGSIDYYNYRQRFRLEAQLGASLSSPNPNPHLIQVFDFIETKDELALEMEYAPGGNLADRMLTYKSKSIPFPKELILKIAYEIASGLTTLHEWDIVHRDLKPANILFDQYDHARIADLGLAQVPGGPTMRSLISFANLHPGTPGYMSPEQRQSSALLTPASDVYALGLVLFEMLTGKNYSIVRPRTRLNELIPGIMPSLNDLLTRMLSEIPKNRPMDGRTVAVELYRELEVEEQAQRAILAKKRRDQEEWERLKNEESARREQQELIGKETWNLENSGTKNQILPVMKDSYSKENEVPGFEVQDAALISSKDLQRAGLEGKVSQNRLQGDHKPHTIWRKYWWFGIILILGIALFPFLNGTVTNPFFHNVVYEPEGEIVITKTIVPISTPTQNQNSIILVQPSTQSPSRTPVPTQPLAHTLTLTQTQTQTQTQSLPTTMPPTIIPTVSPEILLNPGFEETTGWVKQFGDSHIIGQYSTVWASQGKNSYRISLFGDKVYEYCFVPGMRSSIAQKVELSSVDEILFDLNIKPAAVQKDSNGDPVRTKAVVFIDGAQIYASTEGAIGELLDQKLQIGKKYSGRHDLKFSLMTMSKFCVKGNSEAENMAIYIDNIRFVYSQ